MKTWKEIEMGDICVGNLFVETTIEGWNDEEDFTDLENIVTIKATIVQPNKIQVTVTYKYPHLKEDETIKEMVKEQKEEVIKEFEYIYG